MRIIVTRSHGRNCRRFTWESSLSGEAAAKAGSDTLIHLGGESVWLIKAPKHSPSDTIVVFRGVAMTGDIELGTVDSANREVSSDVKAASMKFLRSFQDRTGYYVHTVISAHLNDFRQGVDWPLLFKAG